MEIAEFDLSPSPYVDGDHVVYPNSLLFEVGDYPDKKFTLSDEEMAKAVREFMPGDAPIDYSHVPGVLDGKLGDVEDVRKEGGKLFGVVKIPKWLDAVLPKTKRVSCTWDKQAKKLVGLALVLNPRIEDAALMAAFSASQADDDEGKSTMAKTGDSTMPYEENPMQKHHDMSVAMGAECPGCAGFSSDEIKATKGEQAEFITPALLKSIQHVHDHAASSGADCNEFASRMKAKKAGAYMFGPNKENEMDLTQFEADKAAAIDAAKAEFATQKAEFETKLAEMGEVLTSLTAEIETAKHDAAIADASKFLDDQVKEFRMTPAEKEQWEVKVKADESGLTAFEAVKDILAARPRLAHAPTAATKKFAQDSSAYSASGDGKNIVEMAEELAKEKGISFTQAFADVRKANPDLTKEYVYNRPTMNNGALLS